VAHDWERENLWNREYPERLSAPLRLLLRRGALLLLLLWRRWSYGIPDTRHERCHLYGVGNRATHNNNAQERAAVLLSAWEPLRNTS
jgi:hypothetical protein